MGTDVDSIKLEAALYVVATPIGNIKDITLRALEILNSVDIIASEDTRNTSFLLEKYKIKTKLTSYHKFSESKKAELFLNYLKEGKTIALVSDAGTPLISDPGEILVEKVLNNGFKVIPVSGVNAAITLLSAIPRYKEDFKFIGFMPRVQKQIIETVQKNSAENLVFYESPLRLIDTLKIIEEINPNKKIAIGRELTKKFEEIKIDTVQNIIEYFKTNVLKGEITGMLYADEQQEEIDLSQKIAKLKKLDLKDKEIAKILSLLYEIPKNDIYKKVLSL